MKVIFRKTKHKKIAAIFLVVSLLAATIFFLAKPLYGKVYQAKDELARENLILDNLIAEGKKVDKYKELEEKMKINSQIVDEAIIKKGNEIELIRKIEEVAAELGIKTEISDYAPPKKKAIPVADESAAATPAAAGGQTPAAAPVVPEVKSNYFMISMKGTYPQFLNFLYKIENLGLIVKIESIKTVSISTFELERMLKEGEVFDVVPTLKSDILISYTPQ